MPTFPKILPPFILGIFIQSKLPIWVPENILICTTTICLLWGILSLCFNSRMMNDGVTNLSRFLLILMLGYFIEQSNAIIPTQVPTSDVFIGLIEDPPATKTRTIQCTILVMARYTAGRWIPCREKYLAQIHQDTISSSLEEGNLMIFSGLQKQISEIKANVPTQNPSVSSPSSIFWNSSSYQKYLLRKKITHQIYIDENQWKLVSPNEFPFLRKMAVSLRLHILKIFRDSGLKEDEYSVAAALTLGNKSLLDRETRDSYSAAGASHIMAISGLHTGIVYYIFSGSLFWLSGSPMRRRIRTTILLCLLWFFALMTGLSPSVVRACWMLSLAELGNCWHKCGNSFNYMAASAFIILAIEPSGISDVGFQMSYMAVCSILVLLHDPKRKQSEETPGKNIIRNKVRKLTQVSWAAQAGTAPLTLYYFHQFPTFFLLTNLLVVPLAVLIVFVTFLLVAVHQLPLAGDAVGWMLKILIRGMNEGVILLGKIPGATIHNINFPSINVFLSYLAMVCSVWFHRTRHTYCLYGLLTVLCIWVIG